MTYDHLKKGLKAFEVHVEMLEREAKTLRRCNEALRKDNRMLREILNGHVIDRGFTVIEGGMSQQSIKTMLTDNSA